jgi:hypothetical protein
MENHRMSNITDEMAADFLEGDLRDSADEWRCRGKRKHADKAARLAMNWPTMSN